MNYRTLTSLIFIVLLNGCSLLGIKEELDTVESIGYVEGYIAIEGLADQEHVYAALMTYENDRIVQVDQVLLDKHGRYRFYLFEHNYYIGAYVDADQNGSYQQSEAATFLGYPEAPMSISLQGEKSKSLPDMTLHSTSKPSSDYGGITESYFRSWRSSDKIGTITSWDSPYFTEELANLGMWQPIQFSKQVKQGGLMMFEEYSPSKTPIIFVHGMVGSPKDWQSVIENLDTDKYQPWVFYYPSGLRLDIMSDYLVYAMQVMERRYDFKSYHVAAHSMGGLVARSWLMKMQDAKIQAQLGTFMTVNSPLLGMESANKGVQRSPIVVPAWRDVATGSDFIQRLQAWDLPQQYDYHLAFSYGSGEGDDGVVSIASQLPLKQQQEASSIRGFNSMHRTLLDQQVFIDWFNSVFE